MNEVARFKPQGFLGELADGLMVPLMYVLQGNISESPQRTHFWNNHKFSDAETEKLDPELMVEVPADTAAVQRWWGQLPIFHIPILGGWKKYVVLQLAEKSSGYTWFPGWNTGDSTGVSIIPVAGPVRFLVGPKPVTFFGLHENGEQLKVELTGSGTIGSGGLYASLPLR